MKFGFVINARMEAAQMRECLKFLRASYPREGVVILPDGDYYTDYAEAIRPYFSIVMSRGPRLRTHPTGGRWIERFLYAGLIHCKDADYIIKLDPDTLILRPLSFVPEADVFGYLRPRVDLRRGIETDHFPTLAFCGIRREAAQRILDSGILLDKRFEDSYYDGDTHEEMKTGERLSVASWILYDAARELGLSIAHHPELYLKWREPVALEYWGRFSVVNVETSPWGKRVIKSECFVSAVSAGETHCQCE